MGKIHFINGQLQNPNPRMLKKVLLFFGVVQIAWQTYSQSARDRWVDSVLATMASHEKIGQHFILQTKAPANGAEINELIEKIKRFHPGGVEFVGRPYGDVAAINRRLRASSTLPLIIGWDETYLLALADSGQAFPSHLQLAAVSNDSLAREVYTPAANWVRSLGVDYTTGMQFNPLSVADTNWNQQLNQVGGDRARIMTNAQRWLAPLAHTGGFAVPGFQTPRDVLNSAKGDTLRIVPVENFFFLHDLRTKLLRSTDFQFQVRTENQVLHAARSGAFIQDVIRQQLGYGGLLTYVAQPNENEDYLNIFAAGNNLITATVINNRALGAVTKSLRKNKLLKIHMEQSLRQLLRLKFELMLAPPKPVLDSWRWHAPEKQVLLQNLFESSITVIKNGAQLLPIRNLDLQTLRLINIGGDPNRAFELHIKKYAPVVKKNVLEASDTVTARTLVDGATTLVVAVFDPALGREIAGWLQKIAKKRIVICHMAGVSNLDLWNDFGAVLAGFTPAAEVGRAMAQNLFGVATGRGVLPVDLRSYRPEGVAIEHLPHFAYVQPEAAEIDSETLQKIEPIVREAIAAGATPGAQLVIARKGKVVYQKSFGTLTYSGVEPVTDSTLYDLASVTKVSATLQAVMFLQEKRLIDLDKKASAYLPELKGTNKEDMVLRDILTHQAGLWPFLPFWASTMKDSVWLPEYYKQSPSPDFPWPVAENLFAHESMKDSLWNWIIQSKVREKRARTPYDYRYSDMGFYILQHLAEKLLNQPLEEFLEQNVYQPLGAFSLGYLPRNRYAAAQIAPTERDQLFRKSLLVGYVHDQGAAMHGGVAGHAGLFGTALDLAKLGQLWLNGGFYGDARVFKSSTVEAFTIRQFATSRRGLGWDKPLLNDWSSPTAFAASPLTFGHTGFTGTCVWIDPAYELVYVFLSNRVHPDMNNNKLLNLNIRPRIQEVLYQSIFNYLLYQPAARN